MRGIGTENLEESRPGVIDLKEAYDLTVADTHPVYNPNKVIRFLAWSYLPDV
jgi:hypothetical protein